jgi:hypothetical protein
MKRTKRFTLRRVALGLAVAAVFAPAAQAEPTPSHRTQVGRAAVHVDFWNYDAGGNKIADTSPGVAPEQLAELWSGSNVAIAPDDLALSRPSNLGSPSVASIGSGFELGLGTVSGFGVALVLLIGGTTLAIRHGRKTRLSPA